MIGEELLDKCLTSPSRKLRLLFKEAFKVRRAHFPNIMCFSMPGMVHFDTPFYAATNLYRFPAISITGGGCHLNCEHCGRKILEYMIPATNARKLLKVCTKIKEKGGKGCLISGGALRDGSVPLMRFIPTIRRVKRELGLNVVVHTGIVYPKLAEALAEAGIDAAMIDVVGSNETLQRVYHLNVTEQIFDRSLSLLERSKIPIVPHIVVGLHYGKLRGEKNALKIVSRHKLAALIIVALMPLEKTPMENVKPPQPIDVARVILAARFMTQRVPVMLGCARPWGKHRSETDILAIKAGVNGIAYPSEEGYSFANKVGFKIRFSEECCALTYRDLIDR